MKDKKGEIEVAGGRQPVSLDLLPDVKAGDWVLVNLGAAIARLDEAEAREILSIYQEMLADRPENAPAAKK